MHPPLYRPHPLCEKVVDLLVACHNSNPVLKYVGACNDLKTQLDACFKAEKEAMRTTQRVQQRSDTRVSKLESVSSSEDEDFLKWYNNNKDSEKK